MKSYTVAIHLDFGENKTGTDYFQSDAKSEEEARFEAISWYYMKGGKACTVVGTKVIRNG